MLFPLTSRVPGAAETSSCGGRRPKTRSQAASHTNASARRSPARVAERVVARLFRDLMLPVIPKAAPFRGDYVRVLLAGPVRRLLTQDPGGEEDQGAANREEDLVNALDEEVGSGRGRRGSRHEGQLHAPEGQAHQEPHRNVRRSAAPLALAHPADPQAKAPVLYPFDDGDQHRGEVPAATACDREGFERALVEHARGLERERAGDQY